jgi:thiamine biosynthesis lipoprotein
VKHPRDDSKQSIVLPLSNTAVSTSGDYERFFIDDQGERVHHILSPNTGKPVKGIMSVTILANNAISSDGLSTAVFVLGVKDGLALINKLKGVDAILIDEFGKVHYSDNLMRPTVH